MSQFSPRSVLPPLAFRKYRFTSQPVHATQLDEAGEVANRFASTGNYSGKPGDWRITYAVHPDGTRDEAICDGELFATTYEHLGGDRYQKKPLVIEAAQLDRPLDIETLEGPAHGEPGDWLLIGMNGEPYFNDDAYFRSRYKPA